MSTPEDEHEVDPAQASAPSPVGAHEHGHDHHDHDHAPPPELADEAPPADPTRWRRWRAQLVVGGLLGLAGWIGWPTVHVLLAYRPLRRIQAAPATLGLALTTFVALFLLTATPEPRPAGPHRVGQLVIRLLAGGGVAVALANTAIGRMGSGAILLDIVAFPLVIATLVMAFAYIGRLHRMVGSRRFANLADLTGLVLPLLWAGGQFTGGYPGPYVWGPGLAGMALGGVCLLALVTAVLRAEAPGD